MTEKQKAFGVVSLLDMIPNEFRRIIESGFIFGRITESDSERSTSKLGNNPKTAPYIDGEKCACSEGIVI